MFEYRFIRFQYDPVNMRFEPIVFDCDMPCHAIHNRLSGGISTESEYRLQLIKYGKCNLEVPEKSFPRLL